ncbi:MAG: hypothetical protein KDE46_20170 [Caldilineaceae bacterium]|nr:hypothetical protein [Caldilineaceae bacterium]
MHKSDLFNYAVVVGYVAVLMVAVLLTLGIGQADAQKAGKFPADVPVLVDGPRVGQGGGGG